MFCRVTVPKYFKKVTGKHLSWSFILVKVQTYTWDFSETRTPFHVSLYDFNENFQNSFFREHFWTAPSELKDGNGKLSEKTVEVIICKTHSQSGSRVFSIMEVS